MTFTEYIAGLIFIKGLKIKLWDYSNRRGNIQGIVCPLFSLLWGLIAAGFVYLLFSPLHTAALWAAESAASADAALGFATEKRSLLLADFARVCGQAAVATDDGSLGLRGTAIDAAEKLLAQNTYDLICACGPKILLRRAAELAAARGIPCQISMEERMGCGVGACLVCAVKLRDKNGEAYYGHVCKDGPVFSSEEVVFDD